MALKANYEFLFFGRDDNSFLENYSYDLFQEHGDKSGQIFINLEIQNNPVDAEDIGEIIFQTMQKVFFEDISSDPYQRFEVSLKAVNGVLNEFKAKKSSGYIGNLNITIGAILSGTLYLSQTGDSETYLVRKRYVSVISEGLSEDEDNGGDVFANIASGDIEAGDFVLFSSVRLLRYISKTDLAKSIHKDSIEETLNDLRDVMSTEILGRVGLTGIIFSEATFDDVEAIEDEVDSATKNVLESSGSKVTAHKESLTGRFMTAIKGFSKKDRPPNREGVGLLATVKGRFTSFSENIFAKGFGKDKILALLVIVIALLVVGILIANSSRASRDELVKLDKILDGIHLKLTEAETKSSYDKEAAKEILNQAYLDSMTVLNSNQYRDKAKQFLVQIDAARDRLDNVQRVENPKVLVDLATKRSDVNALGFANVGDRVFAYEYNALYEVVLDQVTDPLTIDDKEKVVSATGFADRKSVVFLTQSGKLIEYKDGTMSYMDTDDGAFRKGTVIRDWSNKIYFLDPIENQIWKYTYRGTRESFGVGEAYLAGDDVDLADGVSFAIDSNVYVLRNSGDVSKYYGGTKAEFFVNNAPLNSAKDPKVIYTTDKLDQVFVLDAKESRVLVYNKDAKTGNIVYEKQYLFDGVGELRDIYVNGASKKLNILSASKIYELDL